MKQRDSALDFLRLCGTLAVLLLHITGAYLGAATDTEWFGSLYRDHMLFSSILHSLTRFAVPCFIMITGAVTISRAENQDYQLYYRKTIRRMGFPFVVFSLLYFLAYMLVFSLSAMRSGDYALLLYPVQSFLTGAPGYHLWYLYMMLGVYVLLPWIIRLKNTIGESAFARLSIIFFVLATISMECTDYTLFWSPGLSFSYLSYAMVGYVIHQRASKQKQNGKACIDLLLALGLGILLGILRYRQAMQGIDDADLTYDILQPYSPLPVLMSVLLFAGFSKMRLPASFDAPLRHLDKHSLIVYLIHPGLFFVMQRFVSVKSDCRVTTLIMFLALTCFSYLFSILWNAILPHMLPRKK